MSNPLDIFKEIDGAFFEALGKDRALAFEGGTLSKKEKFLIALALDASKGAVGGVRTLALSAMDAGATKEEIAEALRITYFICGAVSTFTAAEALKDIF